MSFADADQVFCDIDDFVKEFLKEWEKELLGPPEKKNMSRFTLSPSEVMTIIVLFHSSGYRTFKHFYINHVCKYMRNYFPNLVSYNRFVELQQSVIVPLCGFLMSRKGEVTGISFIDSTPIIVCHNRRINSHKGFKHVAKRGKNSMGWFYGFKLHIVTNDKGELLAVKLTPGNVDDRDPVQELTTGLIGKLFGDKGYISKKLFEELFARGLQMVTRLKKNMKNKLMPMWDKIMLRKRAIIETVIDQLKNISQIEHSRHRSDHGFMVNLVGGLIAYTYRDKKPSLNIEIHGTSNLPIPVGI